VEDNSAENADHAVDAVLHPASLGIPVCTFGGDAGASGDHERYCRVERHLHNRAMNESSIHAGPSPQGHHCRVIIFTERARLVAAIVCATIA
jgi:hypothetical protein